MAASGVSPKTLPAIIVTTAGNAKSLYPTPLLVYGFVLQSIDTNSGLQYFGDKTVVAGNGMILRPGDSVEGDPPQVKGVDQFDISQFYVNASENNTEFRVLAWIRE